RLDTPASDALALEGARLVARYLRRAYAAPADIEARAGRAQGSLAARLAVGPAAVAGAHCLAEATGGRWRQPHGACAAVGLPPAGSGRPGGRETGCARPFRPRPVPLPAAARPGPPPRRR